MTEFASRGFIAIANSAAVVVRLCCALVLTKILAVYLGPSGLAVAANILNALNISGTLSGGYLGQATTKVVASYSDVSTTAVRLRVFNTWLKIALPVALVASLIIAFYISKLPLEIPQFSGFAVFFYSLLLSFILSFNLLLLGLFAGEGHYYYNICSLTTFSILQVVFAYLFVEALGVSGFIVAFFLRHLPLLCSTLFFCIKQRVSVRFQVKNIKPTLSTLDYEVKKIGLASIFSLVSVPLVYLTLRSGAIFIHGEEEAGFLQASWRLSDAYLLVFSSFFSLILLPELSRSGTIVEAKKILFKFVKFSFFVYLVLCGCLMIVADDLVRLLFSSEFNFVVELIPYQLIGDGLKLFNMGVGFFLISRGMIKNYLILEVFCSVALIVFAGLLSAKLGLFSVVFAHIIVSFWALCSVYFFCVVPEHKLRWKFRLCSRIFLTKLI